MLKRVAGALGALWLGGCASLYRIDTQVSTFGPWPPQRAPACFVFERLPSQQAHPQAQQQLEDAALGATLAAGFHACGDPAQAEYLFQLGARVISNDPWFYNEPLFWRVGWRDGRGHGAGYGHWGRGWGGMGGWYGWPAPAEFEREVALVIRDRQGGQLLYEAHATNTGGSPSIEQVLPALFRAALSDFPAALPQPHAVSVDTSAP